MTKEEYLEIISDKIKYYNQLDFVSLIEKSGSHDEFLNLLDEYTDEETKGFLILCYTIWHSLAKHSYKDHLFIIDLASLTFMMKNHISMQDRYGEDFITPVDNWEWQLEVFNSSEKYLAFLYFTLHNISPEKIDIMTKEMMAEQYRRYKDGKRWQGTNKTLNVG